MRSHRSHLQAAAIKRSNLHAIEPKSPIKRGRSIFSEKNQLESRAVSMMIATTKNPTFGPWQDYDTIDPRISERYFLSVRDLGLAPRKAFGAQKSRQFVLFSVKWAPTVGTVGTKTPTVGTNRKQIRRWVKTSSDLIHPIIGLLWDILSSLNLVFVALTLIWSYMFIDGKYNNPLPLLL